MSRTRYLFTAVLIVLVAMALRLIALDHIPPGLHYDEAANGVLVRGIAYGGARPIFISAYTGKETLWFYLAALIVRITGPVIFGLRLTSALIGTLTVAVTGWMVRQLYPGDERRDWLSLLSMAVLAVAFWHCILSRLAFRAISQPLMQALGLGFLWKALRAPSSSRRGRLVWFILAGIATGLTAYTYLAARLFPIPLGVALLALLTSDRERARRLSSLLIYGVSALLVIAPLGLYFLGHPGSFSTRIDQVGPGSTAEALDGLRAALGIFFLAGDPLWRFNIPGKPLFGGLLGIFFCVGWLLAVSDLLSGRLQLMRRVWPDAPDDSRALTRARGALLMVWPLVMLAPTALAVGSIIPSNLRAVGLAPLVVLYPALGLATVLHWLRARLSGGQGWLITLTHLAPALALLLIVYGAGAFTLRDTLRWGAEPVLYYDNDAHVAAVTDYLNGMEQFPGIIYVATHHYRHPALAFLLHDYGAVKSLFGGDALVLAPAGDTLAIYTRDAPPPAEWRTFLEPYLTADSAGPDGTPDFWAYHFPEGSQPIPRGIVSGNFANILSLEEWPPYSATSGDVAQIDLAWRILAPADHPDYAFVAEICDIWGWCWFVPQENSAELRRSANATYLSEQWTPGEMLLTRLQIPLPPGIPPGDYNVRVAVYSAAADARLPVLDEIGAFAGTFVNAGPLRVIEGPITDLGALPIQYWLSQRLTSDIVLLGYDRTNEVARPGERLRLALYWYRSPDPEGGVLRDPQECAEDTVSLTLDDGTELYRGRPFHNEGMQVLCESTLQTVRVDRYDPRLPADLAPGNYAVLLSLNDGPPVRLGELLIEETDRTYEVPTGITLLEPPVVLGEQVSFLGYDIPAPPVTRGETLQVVLIWRAEQEMETSYTVFVHLLDENGVKRAQQDGIPLSGSYPTDLWLPSEIVVDKYELPIPSDLAPGTYTLSVGLYVLETGQRLSVPGSPDNAIVLPVSITIP